jgi:ubiquitin C-terminal hydrolase
LKSELDQLYSDLPINEYRLFGVFLHEGGANFGHYSQYLYDRINFRWLKYNDATVSTIPEDLVFQDTSGRTLNAFSLIYVKSDMLESLTNPMARSQQMRDLFRCYTK